MLTNSDLQEIDRLLEQWHKAGVGGLVLGGGGDPLAALAARGTRAPTTTVVFQDEVARTEHVLEEMHKFLRNALINSRFDGKRGFQEVNAKKVSRMTAWRRRKAAEAELAKAEEDFITRYRAHKFRDARGELSNQSTPQSHASRGVQS